MVRNFSKISSLSVSWSSLPTMLPSAITRSLDELVRSDFQSLRDSYFTWLLICTAIVAAGVVLEEFDDWELISNLLRKRLAKLGWLLIVLGVIGEGVFE